MTKQEFIDYMKPILKQRGYRKTRGYWHRENGELIDCIFVQGSQWDTNNYYVEVGWALPNPDRMKPTQTEWYARGRVRGINPLPQQLLDFLNGPSGHVTTALELSSYLGSTRNQYVCGQYIFRPI